MYAENSRSELEFVIVSDLAVRCVKSECCEPELRRRESRLCIVRLVDDLNMMTHFEIFCLSTR